MLTVEKTAELVERKELVEVEVTVDSGAIRPVCNPKHFPGVVMQPKTC